MVAQASGVKLTPEQKRAQTGVIQSYNDFWNQIQFRKGWSKPPFERSQVEDLLARAAAIVVRIRSELDRENPGFVMRMLDGSARDFFFRMKDSPRRHPERFVRQLVHATLRDAHGYVEGLTKKRVDEYIESIDPSVLAGDERDQEDEEAIMVELEKLWGRVMIDMGAAIHLCKQESERGRHHPVAVRRVVAAVTSLGAHVESLTDECVRAQQSEAENKAAGHDNGHAGTHKKKKKKKRKSHSEESQRDQTPAEAEAEAMDSPETAHQPPSDDEDMAEPAPEITRTNPSGETMPVDEDTLAAPGSEESALPSTPSAATDISDVEDAAADAARAANDGLIQVKRVEMDLEGVKAGITDVQKAVGALDAPGLADRPEEASEVLAKLQAQCSRFSDSLMQDLAVLDSVSDLKEEDRPLRKKQVNAIQALIDDVQSLAERLRKRQHELREQVQARSPPVSASSPPPSKAEATPRMSQGKPEAPPKPRAEKEDAMSASPASSHESDAPARIVQFPEGQRVPLEQLREIWREMRLQPRFDVQEAADRYVLQAYIPGMDRRDIEVFVSGPHFDVATVKGVKLPSERELMLLIRESTSLEHMLRLGANRFGSFVEKFRLADDCDPDRITAHYEGGILRIMLHKRPMAARHHAPGPRRGMPMGPRGGGGFPQSFYNDRDFWW